MTDVKGSGTREKPWILKTPGGETISNIETSDLTYKKSVIPKS